MLSVDNAVEYLLASNMVSMASILEGDLLISSAARRNRNLRVSRKDGPGYLIKQPDDGEVGGAATLSSEAAFYEFCQTRTEAEPLAPLLPGLLHFDRDRALLAIELFEDADQLWKYYMRPAQAPFPTAPGRLLGSALSTVHTTLALSGLGGVKELAWLQRSVPWVMQVHKPGPGLLATISPANYQTLRILQTQEDLSRRLDAIRAMWQPKCVIHGDVKSDNVLIVGKDGDPGPPEIRLVDWETLQIGDPAWDIAGALQDFILFWISSMPVGIGGPDEMVNGAVYPLATIQPAMRAFWRAYRSTAALTRPEADVLLMRAVQFSAARLIQSAYEMAQSSQALPATSVLTLQIGSNILAGPELAQVQLFGIFQEVTAP
jgi:hypothetical protein